MTHRAFVKAFICEWVVLLVSLLCRGTCVTDLSSLFLTQGLVCIFSIRVTCRSFICCFIIVQGLRFRMVRNVLLLLGLR